VARELGIPADRWIFPLVNAESNFMLELCRRPELHRCVGAEIAGARALEHAGIGVPELDLVELYSCFPVAVQTYARALGIGAGVDLTVTGGMPFAGGPFNNYVLQSTCRMVELLRSGPDAPGARHALVSAVSGVLTKQGITIWSTEPGARPFAHLDVTADVAATTDARQASAALAGAATVVATTVLHAGERPRAVALVEDHLGVRGFGTSEDPELVSSFETADWVGRAVEIGAAGALSPVAGES
jgi:acetyl-CoA C-acetyltransferase